MAKKTTEQFIKDATKVHGNTYDYTFSEYSGAHNKVKIVCKIHGEFRQSATSHLSGNGCTHCGGTKAGNFKRKSNESFVEDAIKVHGGYFDYSKVNYINSNTTVIISCPIHGDFLQTPSNHVYHMKGCMLCSAKKRAIERTENIISDKLSLIEQPSDFKIIPLTKGLFTFIDNEDFESVSKLPWTYASKYAYNGVVGYLHRFLMSPDEGLVVDHINRNPLDNRRNNLRVCTQKENNMNSPSKKTSSSIFKGVSFTTKDRKWVAQIKVGDKNIYLWNFSEEDDAARVYDKKALEVYGDFAFLNFPELKQQYLKEIII